MTHVPATGKIALGGLMGDRPILITMRPNEADTVTAYERASDHPSALPKTLAFFQKALADERRHRDWMQRTADMV